MLDRETYTSFDIAVSVTDGGYSDSATVQVRLTDINDNTPTFTQDIYTFPAVNETAAIGQVVGRVQATDKDDGSNGAVRYRLVDAEDGPKSELSQPA